MLLWPRTDSFGKEAMTMLKRVTALLLCLGLVLGLTLPARAQEAAEEGAVTTLTITGREGFLAFAENCRLDTYSLDLVVTLEADIDLTGCDFSGVPIFQGTFEGGNHKITGLRLTGDGSMQGLFRCLTEDALVRDLTVSGVVQPGGTRKEVGGIAGRNEGRIENCVFSGTVSGGEYVGGMAGTNAVTGVIENCRVTGAVYGSHFVGGLVGENTGVIRGCTNEAAVNSTPQQNTLELSDITLGTLTNAEAVNTVTDIGGIAGISSGVIRSCRNHAGVGHQQMGYNIGGIAGTQSGYLTDCENHGTVRGRKEVGGIVGQMEPAAQIEYTEDTLQILQGQLNTMSGLVNHASGNAQANAGAITDQLGLLQDQTDTAMEAVDALFPKDGQLPDADTVLAAQNTLTAALNAMPDTLSDVASATETTLYSLTRDLNAISGQISAMSRTLNSASENLGGTVTDISDQDTPELLTGKVERCVNYGPVLADINAGGIAGAMAMENDLDILEDWESRGEESLNFHSDVRAVVLDCRNCAVVTGKKQNAGGITGWQSLGLVKRCANTGMVDAADADYAGGISGLSTGYIRECWAKCEIRGKTCVGGIAGSAAIVTDSLTQVKLLGGREKLGAVLGWAEDPLTEEEEPIARNGYLCVEGDPGAIDGISYAGLAEAQSLEGFLAREGLPELFTSVTIRFVPETGEAVEITLAPGDDLAPSRIPAVPEKDGFTGTWKGLEDTQLNNILFDLTFTAEYSPYLTVIAGTALRPDGRPVLLAEGSFTADAAILLEQTEAELPLTGGERLLESWEITLSETPHTLRFLSAEDGERLNLLICTDGSWRRTEYTRDGSYLVFAADGEQLTLALTQSPPETGWIWLAAGALILGVLAWTRLRGKEKTA